MGNTCDSLELVKVGSGTIQVVLGLYTSHKSSPFLVRLGGRITAPHTGLVCILHRFEVVSCVRRYFLSRNV